MLGAHAVAVGGLQPHAARLDRDLRDHRAVVHRHAALGQPHQQPIGHAIRVDARGLGGQDRRRRIEAVTLSDIGRIQPLDIETVLLPQRVFLA